MDKQRKKSEKSSRPSSSYVKLQTPMYLPEQISLLIENSETKKSRTLAAMCKSAEKTKLKSTKSCDTNEYLQIPSRPATSKDFRIFTEKCTSTEMSRFQEINIRRKIQTRGLEETYSQLLADMIKETKEEYRKIVHYTSMNMKIKSCHPEAIFAIQPYKFVGKTEQYQKFLQVRKHFEFKWILHYSVIKQIHKTCVLRLPHELFLLKFDKIRTLNELNDMFKQKVQTASQFIYEFYKTIVAIIEKEDSKGKGKIQSLHYLSAGNGLLSVHVSKCIAHTILSIVRTTTIKETKPYLIFNVEFEDELILEPTAEEVVVSFSDFIDAVIDTAKEMEVLERNRIKGCKNKYIQLCLTEDFVRKCKADIRYNIDKHYQPILEDLCNLNSRFKPIYLDINSEMFLLNISDIAFEEGCAKLNYYTNYLHNVLRIPYRKFFPIGVVYLNSYTEKLHTGLKNIIDCIFGKLSAQHFWEVNDIAETFELIQIRATQTAITTEELMETGKYMAWITNEHLDELNIRVSESLVSLCQIVNLGILTDEHIQLNTAVINWLMEIVPIIEEHSTNFDQLKYEAEENLQTVVEEVADLIKAVHPLLVILDDMDDISRARSYLNAIILHMTKIKQIEAKIKWINKEEVSLNFPESTYAEYEDLKNHIYPFYHLLKICLDVQRNLSVCQDGPFEMLNYTTTNTAVTKFHQELTDLSKVNKKKLRHAQDENLPLKFTGTIDDPDFLNWPAPLKLSAAALKLIDEFKPSVEVMKIICISSLKQRHWIAMSEIAGTNITPNAGTTLRKIMQVDFQANWNEYEIISTSASREKLLLDDLAQLELYWNDVKFTVKNYNNTDAKVLSQLEDVEAVVNDHLIKLLKMKSSVFVKPYEDKVNTFYTKILKIKSTIETWEVLQTQMLELLPIFCSPELKSAMPNESVLFNNIKSIFNSYISLIVEQVIVIKTVETSDITKDIQKCLLDLEIVHQGVVAYLGIVRRSFPRFYFIGNEELLKMLCETKHVLDVEKILIKIFQGVYKLNLNHEGIIGIRSHETDNFLFRNLVEIEDNFSIGQLCSQLEEEIRTTLKFQLFECYKTYKHVSFNQLLSKYPEQVILVVSQIYWTESIESALKLTHNIKLRMCYQKLENAIKDKIITINSDINFLDRLKLKSLIINDINNKSVIDKILSNNELGEHVFEWEAHIRYYIKCETCSFKMMNTKLAYMYEYLGNSSPVVSTPLTDRCYRTLINAYYLHFNGLIRGSSGTGKSTTIKNLARAFGVYFIAFSCPRKLNCFTLERLLKGNSLCGSWLCLENFAVLNRGVLSVISQEVVSVLAAKKANLGRCTITGESVALNSACFISASIKTDGYNVDLPVNLKVTFRVITMMIPDIDKIAETILYSYGFRNAKVLSRKIVCVFNLCRDILQPNGHYNFGLNNLKTVLLECEQVKLEYSGKKEESVVCTCLHNSFAAQMLENDRGMFENIINDTFPNISEISSDRSNLEEVILKLCVQEHLHTNQKFSSKILSLYESVRNGHCTILIGETYSGKTTILKLCRAIFETVENITTTLHFVNPNYLDYDLLFGYLDDSTHYWFDGVVTKLIRSFSSDSEHERNWLIFDGSIETSWIENVIPLLEEMKFYLESGDVLTLPDSSSVIFEVKDLSRCSPSIVSTCAIVYMDASILGWKPMVESWVEFCKSQWIHRHRNRIHDILCWIIPPCLDFMKKNCHQLCYPSEMNLVRNMILVTQLMLDDVISGGTEKIEETKNLSSWIQATIIQAGVLGMGSLLDTSSRHRFDEFYKLLWKGQNVDWPYPKSLESLDVSIPQEGLIFDYQYMYKHRGNWKQYHDLLMMEKIVESPYMYEFLVPTADTARYQYLLKLFVKYKHPLIFIGPSGTGKSLLIEDALINKLDKNQYEIAHLNFSLNINSRQTQTFILSKLNKRKSGFYSAPPYKNFLIFIDNLNLVAVDKNGNSTCLELLRQYMDHKVWYDLKTCQEIRLESLNVISAMGLVEGSQKRLCQRFLRHFNIFALNEFSEDTITKIYTNSLLHVWRKGGFHSDISTIVNQIVAATLNIYKQIKSHCTATINRCYYIFNLSNFSKVIQGCCKLKKEAYDVNKKIYLKLWVHEILRVFGDRLNILDNIWLQDLMKGCISREFNESLDVLRVSGFQNNNPLAKIMFSSIVDRELSTNRRYEETSDTKKLIDILTSCLNDYNYYNKNKLEVLFFAYALENLMKIARILTLSPGNAILLGAFGSGRQSLTKLASHVYKQLLFQPIITQSYSIRDWNNYIKIVLKEAGGHEHHCVLLITEAQLVEDMFFLNIEHILRNGEVPGLYTMEDKQEILELARLSAQGGNKNLEISSSDVFLYFHKRCKENLHLILCFSPIGQVLRNTIRNYPSIINCHFILWEDWPDESLQGVALTWMENLKLESDVKEKIIDASIYFHRDSQELAKQTLSNGKLHVYVTSSSFVHLVKLFIQLTSSKQLEISLKKKRYLQGLEKLSYAENQILSMQKALAEYQPQLEAMTHKAVEMTKQIALETIEVEKASALVRKDETIASEQAIVAQILKSECESELAQAIPILEDAILALNTLKPSDITLVKSMKNPPDAIKLVMAAVCVIKDVKADRIPDPSTGRKTIDYWGPSKRILGDMNFLQTLKDFDKDHIKPEIMVKIRKEYIPHKDFKPHIVAKASSAAEGLCKWIIAMDMYDKVAKEVAPKKIKLEKAEREYANTMEILNEKKEEVTRIEEKLAGLNLLLEDATTKQKDLQREVDICNKKLGSAQKLIGSLSGEKIRWTDSVKNLEKQECLLPGNILLSSGIIAYLAPFEAIPRNVTVKKWHQYVTESLVPCCDNYSIVKSLSSESKNEIWQQNGLLHDNFCMQNAVIQEFSKLFSLLVDPEYQADTWIKKIEKRNNLIITKFTHTDYLSKLKHCIITGKPILIHKIKDNVPACLNQFISKQIYIDNDETIVSLNNEDLKLNSNFRLYMISNLRCPEFSLEIYNNITLINFSITTRGLEEILLKFATEIEKPELKKLRKTLNLKKIKNRFELAELENKILRTLCESETDILEDEAAIKILDQSKDLAQIVREKQEDSKHLEETIEEYRSKYDTVPRFATNLYFCLVQLPKLNYIYQYSLEWFIHLYFQSILQSERSKHIEQRCKNINNSLAYDFFFQITHSLYDKDKVTFLLLLATSILVFNNKIAHDELMFFLKTGESSGSPNNKSSPQWLEENAWRNLCQLEQLKAFDQFLTGFIINSSSWCKYVESTSNENIPKPWDTQLSNFQKLILIKILKPSQLLDNIKIFIEAELGERFTQNLTYNVSDTYNESYSLSPILFILTAGVNPLETVRSLARRKNCLHTFKVLSCGENNSLKADSLIDEAQRQGSWLFLQNCHLDPDWFDNLESKLTNMDYDNTNENFRLWLTSEPVDGMPVELLQTSIKVIDEPPEGVKLNLTRLYNTEPITNPEFYSGCPAKHDIFTRLVYGVCFFHCILNERRKFETIGWNCPYFFDDTDLKVSLHQMQMIINESIFSLESFKKLAFIIGHCQYGAYVDNIWDFRLLLTLLKNCINPDIIKSTNYFFNNIMPYGLPKKSDRQDYMNYISKLPTNDSAEIFGLREFSNDCIKIHKSDEISKSVLVTLEHHVLKSIGNNESVLLTSIEDMMKLLPEPIHADSVQNYVTLREIQHYNNLIDQIYSSLNNLKKCVTGVTLFSFEYEIMAEDIINARVPKLWLKCAFPNQMNLARFMESLKQRVEYFRNISCHDNKFWLAAFFFPRALITKSKMDFSKSLKMELDSITFNYKIITKEELDIDSKCIVVDRLYILGAKWDEQSKKLTESSTSVNNFPSVTFLPVNISEFQSDNTYKCPMYQSSDLRRFIEAILIPTDMEQEHWIKRGVKLICQIPR